MSKGQRGNKEAKKSKKVPVPVAPAGGLAPSVPAAAASGNPKRR